MTMSLFADDTMLLAEIERELQRVVDQFHSVCTRKKLRVNAKIVSEIWEVKVVDFGSPYRVSIPVDER